MPTRSPGSSPSDDQPPAQAGHLLAQVAVGRGLAAGDHRDRGVGVGVDDRRQVHAGSPAQAARRRRRPSPCAQAVSRYRPDHPGDARSPCLARCPGRWFPLVVALAVLDRLGVRRRIARPAGRARRAPWPPPRRPPIRARSRSSSSRINSLRASKGLRQLQVDGELTGVARRWTDRMVAQRPDQPQPEPRIPGERQLDEARRERGRGLRRRRADAGVHQQPRALPEPRRPRWTHVGVGVTFGERWPHVHHPQLHGAARRRRHRRRHRRPRRRPRPPHRPRPRRRPHRPPPPRRRPRRRSQSPPRTASPRSSSRCDPSNSGERSETGDDDRRRRDPRPDAVVPDRGGPRRAHARRAARRGPRAAGTQRRRQDHHGAPPQRDPSPRSRPGARARARSDGRPQRSSSAHGRAHRARRARRAPHRAGEPRAHRPDAGPRPPLRGAAHRRSCWSASAWPTAPTSRCRARRPVSASGSRWRGRSSTIPMCCSSTSRPRGSTRRPPGTSSTSSAPSRPSTAAPSCSARTSSARRGAWPTGWPCSTAGSCTPSAARRRSPRACGTASTRSSSSAGRSTPPPPTPCAPAAACRSWRPPPTAPSCGWTTATSCRTSSACSWSAACTSTARRRRRRRSKTSTSPSRRASRPAACLQVRRRASRVVTP